MDNPSDLTARCSTWDTAAQLMRFSCYDPMQSCNCTKNAPPKNCELCIKDCQSFNGDRSPVDTRSIWQGIRFGIGTCDSSNRYDCKCKLLVDKLPESPRKAVIARHNALRSALARNTVTGKINGKTQKLPPAKAIFKLKYDTQMESLAIKRVSNCSKGVPEKTGFGRLIKWSKGQQSAASILGAAMNEWWRTKDTGAGVGTSVTVIPGQKSVHFAQMAYFQATKFGCAVNYCRNLKETIACCYYDQAIQDYAAIYELGNACTGNKCKCTKESCEDKRSGATCEASTGLCVAP